MADIKPAWVEKVRLVLVDEGADSEQGWHSWRCFDRDRYPDPCTCTYEAAGLALEAVADDIRADALREAADALDAHSPAQDERAEWTSDIGYYGEGAWLRDRAARIAGDPQ